MSQNLPAVPSQHHTSSRPLAPVPPLPNPSTTMPNRTEHDLTAVATPRLRAANPTHHSIPATARQAGTMPPAALTLRHQALPHLGITPMPTSAPTKLSAVPATTESPATHEPAPADSHTASTTAPTAPVAASTGPSAAASPAPAESPAAEQSAGSGRVLAVVPVPAERAAPAGAPMDARARAAAAGGPGLPDARAWGGRLAQAVSEVLAGDRPISQLVRFTDDAVFADLNRRVRLLGLTTTATARGAKERSSLASVRVCTPAHEIAEIAAHVRHGNRSRAIALRLEIRRNRWVCTALELG